eukprot:353364-Chlamydomonas_euryale.AAC.8
MRSAHPSALCSMVPAGARLKAWATRRQWRPASSEEQHTVRPRSRRYYATTRSACMQVRAQAACKCETSPHASASAGSMHVQLQVLMQTTCRHYCESRPYANVAVARGMFVVCDGGGGGAAHMGEEWGSTHGGGAGQHIQAWLCVAAQTCHHRDGGARKPASAWAATPRAAQ